MYAVESCYEAFPFPGGWQSSLNLEEAGRAYYEFRATLMARARQGLTKTYNRLHDQEDGDPEIGRLRELHDALDRAVVDTYGWSDLRPTCDFLPDFEDENSDPDDDGKSRRRAPSRYRWPDQVRDEVLSRLLALNQERAGRGALPGHLSLTEAEGTRCAR